MSNNAAVKHPPSLKIFFATEMWERYGFYVVQSLLALYMALHLHWPDDRVYALVGSFTALTYLSPIIGGWIADRLLGQKRSILIGAIVLFFSYSLLSLITSDFGLNVALAGIAAGTGLLKPNISSLLGNEYPLNSPKRESGFTIFYMGITTGIILGTTLPSFFNDYFGWSCSFASAAIGMIFSCVVFAWGIKKYAILDYQPFQWQLSKIITAVLLIIGLWIISFYILQNPVFADLSFGLVIIGAVIYFIYAIQQELPAQARQTMAIGLLCIISVMFWAFYFQMFLSLTLLLSRIAAPALLGINFPPPYYVTIQSLGMLLFGYIFSRCKPFFNAGHVGIRTGNQFVLSMIFTLLSYGLIYSICYFEQGSTLLSPVLFIPAYLLLSIAELLLSPVGLAAITTLASRQKVSTMMGVFFVSLGLGAYLAGKLANITAITDEHLAFSAVKLQYTHSFAQLFLILTAATLICLLLNLLIKKFLKTI